MSQDRMEIALIKYNKKTWCKSALLGFLIGLAVIVPGISGSTVAIIFKLYDQFLYAIGNLFKRFKVCFLFLLPIGLGLIVGFMLGFLGVKQLLEINLFAVVCLFAGLMSGAFPAVKDEIKGSQWTGKRVALFVLGLSIPILIGCFSAVMETNKTTENLSAQAPNLFENVQWWHILLGVIVGYVVGITQIVPGLSASAFLMTIGWYNSLMSSVSMTFWKANPTVFLVYVGLGIGFLLGLFTFSKLLTFAFTRARQTAYFLIVGLSLGSIVSMFCNGDVMQEYLRWRNGGVDSSYVILSIVAGAVLFGIGALVAYMLVRYERKKTAQAQNAHSQN